MIASIARGDDVPPSTAELKALVAATSKLSSRPSERSWIFGESTSVTLGILAVYSYALRHSAPGAEPNDACGACYCQLRQAIFQQVFKGLATRLTPATSQEKVQLFRWLMRSHVLRCYSALLLSAARQVHHRPSKRNITAAEGLTVEVFLLLRALSTEDLGWSSAEGGPWPAPMPGPGGADLIQQEYQDSLQSELRASSVLDAWSSCYLQLLTCGEWSGNAGVKHLRLFLSHGIMPLQLLTNGSICVLSPRLMYCVAAQVVRLVARRDGGTTYGMPADLHDALMTNNGDPEASNNLLHTAVLLWQISDVIFDARADPVAAVLPPYNAATTFDLCIRIVHGAAEEAWGAKVSSTRRSDKRQQPGGAAAEIPQVCAETAWMGLLAAHKALRKRVAGHVAADKVRPLDAERLQVLWSKYVEVLDLATAAAVAAHSGGKSEALPAGQRGGLGRHGGAAAAAPAAALSPAAAVRSVHLEGCDNKIPNVTMHDGNKTWCPGVLVRPDAEVDAILRAGTVPCMERLVRRRVAGGVLFSTPAIWTQFLMFGPEDHCAALVLSVAKGLRGCLSVLEQLPSRELARAAGEMRLYDQLVSPGRLLQGVFESASEMRLTAVMAAGGGADSPAARAVAGGDGDGRVEEDDFSAEACAHIGLASSSSRCCSSGGFSGTGDWAETAAAARQAARLVSLITSSLLPDMSRIVRILPNTIVGDEDFGDELWECLLELQLPWVLRACTAALEAYRRASAAAADSRGSPDSVGGDAGEATGGVGDGGDAKMAASAAAKSTAEVEAQCWRVLLEEIKPLELAVAAVMLCALAPGEVNDSMEKCARALMGTVAGVCLAYPQQMQDIMCIDDDGSPAEAFLDAANAAEAYDNRMQSRAGHGADGGREDGAHEVGAEASAEVQGSSGVAAMEGVSLLSRMVSGLKQLATAERSCEVLPEDFAEAAGRTCSLMGPLGPFLLSPDKARRLMAMYGCTNPTCTNLAGPSELLLPRLTCGGGRDRGVVCWYCSEECQKAPRRTASGVA